MDLGVESDHESEYDNLVTDDDDYVEGYASSRDETITSVSTTTEASTEGLNNKKQPQDQVDEEDDGVRKETNAKKKINRTEEIQGKQQMKELKTLKRKLRPDCLCPICLEMLIKTQIIVPCGHLICTSCIDSIKNNSNDNTSSSCGSNDNKNTETKIKTNRSSSSDGIGTCPVCQTVATSFSPCRVMDNLIQNLEPLLLLLDEEDEEDDDDDDYDDDEHDDDYDDDEHDEDEDYKDNDTVLVVPKKEQISSPSTSTITSVSTTTIVNNNNNNYYCGNFRRDDTLEWNSSPDDDVASQVGTSSEDAVFID